MAPAEKTILLLDHSQVGLEAISGALQGQGYQVLVSEELPKSLELARTIPPPALILYAPLVVGHQGVEAEILSLLTRKALVPVILVVESVDKLDRASSLALTIRDFVTTPLSRQEILMRVESLLRLKHEFQALKQRTDELSGQVIRDFKTGLYNYRYFASELRREFQRVNRSHRPLALLVLDLDNFKQINDRTEYAFGDKVLASFARLLQENIREVDIAARFGGDEFMVLLPGTTPAEAIQVATRIRNMTSQVEIAEESYREQITVSIGLDCYNGQTAMTPEQLRTQANRALQEAKRLGKNRIWLFSPASGGNQSGFTTNG